MADALKEMFNKKFYERLAVEFNKAHKHFNSEKFVKEVTKDLTSLTLIQRMRNTNLVLKNHLPTDFKKSVNILYEVAPKFKSHFTSFVFPDYIGLYGHHDFEMSMDALKYFTPFGSSEFAIREFLKRDFNKTIKVMNKWAEDSDHHVRRLASEGSRARLPWSFNLEDVMKNPSATKSILEKLKTDEELYVKKSVANHLNDFSKHHSDYLLNTINGWDKTNIHTAWIIKHASRTLIKNGHSGALTVFDFEKNVKVKIESFNLKKSKIKLGETLTFTFNLISEKSSAQKLVIDYAIHYSKQSGELSRKVFKLKEATLQPKEKLHISKSQRFMNFTTRKHYAGKHVVEILINGKSFLKKEFYLEL